MFEEWKFRWKERKLERAYQAHFAKLQTGSDEYQSLEKEHAHFRAELQEERRLHYQKKLLRKAHRLFLPIPQYSTGNWESSNVLYGHLLLKDEAIKQLRNDIR